MKKKIVKTVPTKKPKSDLDVATQLLDNAIAAIQKQFGKKISFAGGFTDGTRLRVRFLGESASNIAWINMALNDTTMNAIRPSVDLSKLLGGKA